MEEDAMVMFSSEDPDAQFSIPALYNKFNERAMRVPIGDSC